MYDLNFQNCYSKSTAALALSFAVCFVVLFHVRESVAQSPLNVWQSNGPGTSVHPVVVDPFNPNVIYAGTSNGLYKSVTNGASWFLASPTGPVSVAVDYVNPNTIYAAFSGGLFKSTNGGLNWSSLNAPWPFYRFGVSQSNPNHIVAVEGDNPLNVFVTTNGGGTWETRPFFFPEPNVSPTVVDFDQQNPNIIYMFAHNAYEGFVGLFKTNNGGASWAQFYYAYGYAIAWTRTFRSASTNSNIVYAGTEQGIYKSTDGGWSWAYLSGLGVVESLAIDPLNPRILYAAVDGQGVFKSTNDGATWSAFNRGLTNLRVHGLAFAPTGRFLHAATTTGVFSTRVETLAVNRKADFDGDGSSDISVFRPSDTNWYLNRSTGGFSATPFGLSTDKVTPADYDGDGKTDIAVFRGGTWYLLRSQLGFTAVQFGQPNGIPQPADFDGDGRAELVVYRGGTWQTLNLATNQTNSEQFGLVSDIPVVGDYDGDARADHAVYRDGAWYLLKSTLGFAAIEFGLPTDKLVPADYDGDGKTDVAVYRGGVWYLLGSQTGTTSFQFGLASDIPVPADYDGDGRTDAAVYRDGVWYLQQSTNGFAALQFGLANDKPVPSAYGP